MSPTRPSRLSEDSPEQDTLLFSDVAGALSADPSSARRLAGLGDHLFDRKPVRVVLGVLLGAVVVIALLAPHGRPVAGGGSRAFSQLPGTRGGVLNADEVETATSPTTTSEAPEPGPGAPEGPQTAGDCGKVDEDTDYEMEEGGWFDHLDHIGTMGACCDLCRNEDLCDSWTWVRDANLPDGNPGQCWMKGGKVKAKKTKAGAVSGNKNPQAGETVGAVDAKGKTHESEAAKEVDEEHECASPGAGCLKSKCCKESGHQCFTKNAYWAQCMEACTPGPNPTDPVSPMPWECKALGARAPGEAKQCSKDGEDCTSTKCCVSGGTQCFEKNSSFALCKPSCSPGPDMLSEDWLPWSCKALGPRTQGAAPWVKTKCATAGTDCSKAQCCADPGHQCYRQSPYYAQCKPGCTKGEKPNPWDTPWECGLIGSRTPQLEDAAGLATGKVSQWVIDRCAGLGADCTHSKCCHEIGSRCFTKGTYYASCKKSCSTEPDPNDNNATWSCKALGPASIGLSVKGYPSLFCFTLYMPSRYEGPLLKAQLKEGAGIFSCDGYTVLAAEEDNLGVDKDGKDVKPIQIPKITVGVSQDGTAGNAKLFMAVWDQIIASNRFRNYDWTIKVDPDAVIVPWRVRDHMKPHVGANVYVVNCNKFPGSPNFPMMYGAVEIFSNLAMDAYAEGSWKCGQQLPWGSWGEDYYMTHCLDFLGVGRISDFGTLGDNLCTGANCADTYTASFHPFKDIGAWMQCWGKATIPPPPPKPAAPGPPPPPPPR